MSDDFVRMCRNPRCRLVCRPDERIHRNANEECPRCGTKYETEANAKVRDKLGVRDGHLDTR